MFSSEHCEIFKNAYFEEQLLTAASDFLKQLQNSGEQLLLYWLFFNRLWTLNKVYQFVFH